MRNSTGGTSTSAKMGQNKVLSSAEKNNAKKLVQARLPFKVIAPGSPPADADINDVIQEAKSVGYREDCEPRKRKLSYESDREGNVRENAANVSKENVEVEAAASKKKKTVISKSSVEEVILLSDEDGGEGNASKRSMEASVTKLSKIKSNAKSKGKGAGTPKPTTSKGHKDKSCSASKLQIKLPVSSSKRSKRRKSKVDSFLAAAVTNISQENVSCADLSDDIEEVAGEFNPQKRTKLDFEVIENIAETTFEQDAKSTTIEAQSTKGRNEQIAVDDGKYNNEIFRAGNVNSHEDEKDEICVKQRMRATIKLQKTGTDDKTASLRLEKCGLLKKESVEDQSSSLRVADGDLIKNKETEGYSTALNVKVDNTSSEQCGKNVNAFSTNNECVQSDRNTQKEQLESFLLPSDDSDDNEADVEADEDADDETENQSRKQNHLSPTANDEDLKAKFNTTIESVKNSDSDKYKPLTPKQKQLMERRQIARLEKERKLLEEKQKKMQEKEEKELAKKREREEKEDQKRKEREEKEEHRRKEREEKERKRLAEMEAKNVEKRKKNEAKEEELRKKEEERKRKEIEKEEVELKKKKAAQAFTRFFVSKVSFNTQQNIEEDETTCDGIKPLAFRPFQVKGDMKLAPLCRRTLSSAAKDRFEFLVNCRDGSGDQFGDGQEAKLMPVENLYIHELKSGHIMPGKWRRPSTETKDDVIIIEDELDRVGQEIVEDMPAYIREEMRVKFFKFHDNRRPPYYGTFRKKSPIVSGRKPFAQDKKFFDYEVDSDDEWEEEEPGESLEDGSDDDKEKDSDDDDYEVDNEWFVPHGHLSDEELQNEDEYGLGDDNTREAQRNKLQLIQQEFAQEMKKKTEKIKPRLIGCIWADVNGYPPQECPLLIWETLSKRSMLYSDPPLVEGPKIEETLSSLGINLENKPKSITISNDMEKDLVRLLHGNTYSKKFLVKEFIAYLGKTEESIKNGECCNLAKSVVREKIESLAVWHVQIINANNANDSKDNTNKKKKIKKRLCWMVKSEVLSKLDMTSLKSQNNWKYILNPKKGALTEENIDSKSDITEDMIQSGTTQISNITEAAKGPMGLPNTPIIHTCEESIIEKSIAENTDKISPPAATKDKKRVPLLLSVASGQQIPTTAKNKLISQFLKKGNTNSSAITSPKSNMKNYSSSFVTDDDVVVILD